MEIAKSYQGEEIHAADPRLNYHSYREKGLRCSICGEPVIYKSGEIKRPHFAHYSNDGTNKYEECPLRTEDYYGRRPFGNPWWHEEGRGQRFYLFQKYFISIIQNDIPDLDISSLDTDPQDIELDDLQSRTLDFARNNLEACMRHERVFGKKKTILERGIVSETFEYLTVTSSRNLFKIVTDHVISQHYKEISKFDENLLCHYILRCLDSVDWLKYFRRYMTIDEIQAQNFLLEPDIYIKRAKDDHRKILYLDQENLWLTTDLSTLDSQKSKNLFSALLSFIFFISPFGKLWFSKTFVDRSSTFPGRYLDMGNDIRLGKMDCEKLMKSEWSSKEIAKLKRKYHD